MKLLKVLNKRDKIKNTLSTSTVKYLNKLSNEIKRDLRYLLKDLNNFHLDSSLTTVDIILGIIYHRKMSGKDLLNINLILSKGHATPALYVIFKKIGLLGDEIKTIAQAGSLYQTHAIRGFPLIKVSTGSLGQGLSIANGLALGMKMEGIQDYVYVIIGDGETDEGQIWEAAATSSTYGLDNTIVIIDRNKKQLSGDTERIKRKEPLKIRWMGFGWEVIEMDVNSIANIVNALDKAEGIRGWPKVIIAK